MDLSTSSLLSGLVIGSIGTFFFMFGKSTQNFLLLFIGIAMFVYPYFISNPFVLWPLTAGLCILPFWISRRTQ